MLYTSSLEDILYEEIHHQPREGDSIVSNYCADDPELLLDVAHGPANAEESSHENQGFPGSKKVAEQRKVEQKIGDIQLLHFYIGHVHCLNSIIHTFGRNNLQNHYSRIGLRTVIGTYPYQNWDDTLPMSRCFGRCTLPNLIIRMLYRVIRRKALVPKCSPFFTWNSVL